MDELSALMGLNENKNSSPLVNKFPGSMKTQQQPMDLRKASNF